MSKIILVIAGGLLGWIGGIFQGINQKNYESWIAHLEEALGQLQNFWCGVNDLHLAFVKELPSLTEEAFLEEGLGKSWERDIQKIREYHYAIDCAFEKAEMYGNGAKVKAVQQKCASWRRQLQDTCLALEREIKSHALNIPKNRKERAHNPNLDLVQQRVVELSNALVLCRFWAENNKDPYESIKSEVIQLQFHYKSYWRRKYSLWVCNAVKKFCGC